MLNHADSTNLERVGNLLEQVLEALLGIRWELSRIHEEQVRPVARIKKGGPK